MFLEGPAVSGFVVGERVRMPILVDSNLEPGMIRALKRLRPQGTELFPHLGGANRFAFHATDATKL